VPEAVKRRFKTTPKEESVGYGSSFKGAAGTPRNLRKRTEKTMSAVKVSRAQWARKLPTCAREGGRARARGTALARAS
jgi:hypothetical protein